MKLQMPKIFQPALDIPLDIDVYLDIEEKGNMELIKKLCTKGWVVV